MPFFFSSFFFFFNDTATTEIYTLSLHDALPIFADELERILREKSVLEERLAALGEQLSVYRERDRKSTRLNSSHGYISYAVFCLKKKKNSLVHRIGQDDVMTDDVDVNDVPKHAP